MVSALDFYATHAFWVWAAVAAALLALEVATGSGWLLWPSAAAAVVAILEQVVAIDGLVAVLIFAVLTIAATFVSRRLMPKNLNEGADINDPAGRLVGHHGRAVAAFSGGQGRVFVDGKEWAARLEEGENLAVGAKVTVVAVDGARLNVRAAT